MPTRTIVVVGGLVERYITEVDEMPERGDTVETTKPIESHTGGRGAVSAVMVHRLSHYKPLDGSHAGTKSKLGDLKIEVRLIATVGEDSTGERLKARMEECGVNAVKVDLIPNASTSRAIIIVDKFTRDHRVWFHAGANHVHTPDTFKSPDDLRNFLGNVEPALLLTNLEMRPDTAEQLIKTAGVAKMEVLLNLVPANYVLDEVLRNVTHLVIHEAEARRSFDDCPEDDDGPQAWDKLVQKQLNRGAKNVVITFGAHGAYFANRWVAEFIPSDTHGPDRISGG